MARPSIHPSITRKRVIAACTLYHESLENPGFCLACGQDANGVEPDARGYVCDFCEEPAVYGAEEVLIMGV